jgi:O-antigen/teichoic acid export membrane protein
MKRKLPARLSQLLTGGIFTGGAILFISTTIVNGGNYLFNLILGRWLGPAAFADLSLIVTIMLMITFVTITYQLTSAKFAAKYSAAEDQAELAGLRRFLGKNAWIIGIILALILGAGAPVWQKFFHTQSLWPFVILSIGLPIYFVQGVDRGILQGQMRFGILSLSYQAEMWVRLVTAVLFVAIGWSINGAVGGITLSFFATWLVARKAKDKLDSKQSLTNTEQTAVKLFAWPVIISQLSQILINNSDILIVKRFFISEEAGLYAALALIGRIVFFATWSVVTVLFPIVAQKHQKGEPHRHMLAISLGLVGAISLIIMLAAIIMPETIINILFGSAYLSVAPLLWLYALATTLYAMANVVINYRLSTNNGLGTTLALFGGVTQVVGLWLFHATLRQVVIAQIYIMTGLFVVLLVWDAWLYFSEKRPAKTVPQVEPTV